MAITVLGNFYAPILENKVNAVDNFIKAVKAISAYYFIWRSAYNNSGLDNTYREFFKSDNKTWKYENNLSVEALKQHIREMLEDKNIGSMDLWREKAEKHLNFKSAGSQICKLAIVMSVHDTIEDIENPGCVKNGRNNSRVFLKLSKWYDNSLKTIEHIAPQTAKEGWEKSLYDDDFLIHSIGNLTLLPTDLNSSAGNKGWKEKYLYYKCVSTTDQKVIDNINRIASENQIKLSEQTLTLLKNTQYSEHLNQLLSLDMDTCWNTDIIKTRTRCIVEIVANRVFSWI